MMREPITEKDNKQEEWYKEADEQTLETLPDFLDMLASKYTHDYGTICHAVTAAAIGAAKAMDRTEQGGITGFQAGAIMWEFIKKWMLKEPPLRLLEMREMCYPQYEDRFNEISEDTWKLIQERAQEASINKRVTGKTGRRAISSRGNMGI
jgi:hypothetical protein